MDHVMSWGKEELIGTFTCNHMHVYAFMLLYDLHKSIHFHVFCPFNAPQNDVMVTPNIPCDREVHEAIKTTKVPHSALVPTRTYSLEIIPSCVATQETLWICITHSLVSEKVIQSLAALMTCCNMISCCNQHTYTRTYQYKLHMHLFGLGTIV